MPNHTHLIAVPTSEPSLRRAIGEAHRRYTRRINFREKWRGYLWQGRFASFVMDEPHLVAAARYVELNPVRARLAARAEDWPWSSARAHLSGRDDCLAKVSPLLAMIGDWHGLLNSALPEEELEEKGMEIVPWAIPERYGNVETSGLTAEVIEGKQNELQFQLHDQATDSRKRP
jgi:putative transposase